MKHAGTGTKVLAYLARYVFRIAISNSRLVRFENGQVTFRYRDNRSGEIKHCVLPAADFIARFLQHVLPRGFTKVRHYGVYSPTRAADLERARELIGVARREAELSATSTSEGAQPIALLPVAVERPCPSCAGGHLRVVETLPRLPSPVEALERVPPSCRESLASCSPERAPQRRLARSPDRVRSAAPPPLRVTRFEALCLHETSPRRG